MDISSSFKQVICPLVIVSFCRCLVSGRRKSRGSAGFSYWKVGVGRRALRCAVGTIAAQQLRTETHTPGAVGVLAHDDVPWAEAKALSGCAGGTANLRFSSAMYVSRKNADHRTAMLAALQRSIHHAGALQQQLHLGVAVRDAVLLAQLFVKAPTLKSKYFSRYCTTTASGTLLALGRPVRRPHSPSKPQRR